MKEEASQSINNYKILETIHDSAEGVMYRAVEKLSGDRVLIKEYYPSLLWSDDILGEFFNLASYLRFIEHEYLLPVSDVGKHEGHPYIVFSDDSFTLLSDRQTEQFSQDGTLNFLYKVAEALDFLHKQEILHGTLSPENIALGAEGYPMLFDFGLNSVLKKLLLENMDDGFDNLSVSNLKCTSPEQILGRNPTRSSDIYAFGIIGYYYIFGKYPFDGKYTPETAVSHFSNGVIRNIQIFDIHSNKILQFIQKCIQLDPEARFASFSQILNILERTKSGKRVRFPFKKRFGIEKPRIRIRFSSSFASAAILVASLLIFYYLYTFKGASPIPPPDITTTVPAATSTREQPATEDLVVETSTESAAGAQITSTPSEQGGNPNKPAFEGEIPLLLKKSISIDNIANLREISRLGYGKPEEIDVAPDNKHMAIATSAGVFIFDEDQFLKWIDPQGWATSVQFSPDGKMLAIGLMTGEIQLWDWQAEIKSGTLTAHTKKINRILFSESGLLYSASSDQHIIVWSLNSNKSIQDIPAHSQAVNDIAITSDGRTLVSCSDDLLIRVWDVNSGDKLYELHDPTHFSGSIKAVAISSDDAYFAAGGESGRLYQWKLITTTSSAASQSQLRTDIAPVGARIWSLQYSDDNSELLVGVDHGVDGGEGITYDAAQIEFEGISLTFEIPKISTKLVDVFGPAFDFNSFSMRRGDGIVSINWDGVVTNQNQRTQILNSMYDNLDRLDFSPDGTILAAGGKRSSTHVWNLTNNQSIYKNLYTLPFGNPIAPDNSSIALIVPGEDIYQIIKLSGTQATTDLSETIPNANVGYTSTGSLFIAANLQTSKAWESVSGGVIPVKALDYLSCRITVSESDNKDRLLVNSASGIFLPGDDALITNLCPKTYQVKGVTPAFSHDLSLIAYMNSNRALEGYDVLKKALAWRPYQLKNPETVTVIAVSPDGSIIAVGHDSGKMLFINGKTGELLSEIVGSFGRLQAIEFSEDGQKIATTGTDGIAHVFGIVEIK